MLKKYLICFLVSMVPIVELRGAIPISQGMQLPLLQSYIICVIGNMLPVPVIYLFARRVLEWGADKKYIGKFFTFCIEKGHKGGEKYSLPMPVLNSMEMQRISLIKLIFQARRLPMWYPSHCPI